MTPRPHMTPARRAWLKKLRDKGPTRRSQPRRTGRLACIEIDVAEGEGLE